ncbi:phenylacetate--CoA ligase family protein [Devosia sp. Root413D1]|uniref:phenylacetate--CoA ligase family protein n=1 Tax=Devosia sp. Root413D1 TaxID=1736531 RepID=UPI0012E33017|nr:phenylacetate--CoA ligase family protein [Devosia sp. Root413D1]
MSVYQRLPVVLQNAACSAYGQYVNWTRYGRGFRSQLHEAEQRLVMSGPELLAFRDRRVRQFVQHAFDTTPFYRDLFGKIGAEAGDFDTLASLHRLPVLNKSELQAQPDAFVSSAIGASRRIALHTSGTTGTGLHLHSTIEAVREQYSIWWRYWRHHGIQQGEWCAYFGGRSVVSIDQQGPPFWRVNIPGRQILFSGYHASPDRLDAYLIELRRRRPLWWHGYPSQFALLAARTIETGFDLGYSPRWITTASENLMPQQRSAILSAFGTMPLQHYGMTEAAANFSQCECGSLHVDEDFSGVEFLPSSRPGVFKVVGTNFSNLATPLLRYDVGDVVVLSDRTCSCGRPGRTVESIDGRNEDYVLLANGSRVGRLDHIFKDMTNVHEAQIRQTSPGAITVLVVRGSRFGPRDEENLLLEFRNRLGEQTAVNVEYVSSLGRTRGGKLRFVVSESAQ